MLIKRSSIEGVRKYYYSIAAKLHKFSGLVEVEYKGESKINNNSQEK